MSLTLDSIVITFAISFLLSPISVGPIIMKSTAGLQAATQLLPAVQRLVLLLALGTEAHAIVDSWVHSKALTNRYTLSRFKVKLDN